MSEETMQRPIQRAHGDVERGFKSCYAQDEADALFSKLETELQIVLQRELASQARHDAKLDAMETELRDTKSRLSAARFLILELKAKGNDDE